MLLFAGLGIFIFCLIRTGANDKEEKKEYIKGYEDAKEKYSVDNEALRRRNTDLLNQISSQEIRIKNLENQLETQKKRNKEFNDDSDSQTLRNNLDKANATIRQANIRINQLKEELRNAAQQSTGQYKESFNVDINCYEWFALTPETANKASIKKQYKRLSLFFHSDKGGSTAMMQTINKMRDQLMKRHG